MYNSMVSLYNTLINTSINTSINNTTDIILDLSDSIIEYLDTDLNLDLEKDKDLEKNKDLDLDLDKDLDLEKDKDLQTDLNLDLVKDLEKNKDKDYINLISLKLFHVYNILLDENLNYTDKSRQLMLYGLDITRSEIDNSVYYLVKYISNSINYSKTYGEFRSIIYKDQRLLSFSPPQSVPFKDFIETYRFDECYQEEIIEGTMINVFYDIDHNKWMITSRSKIGATGTFFNRDKTFAAMFADACGFHNFSIELLNQAYSYSFILQHPENRIVMRLNYPKLFLIKIYKIHDFTIHEMSLDAEKSRDLEQLLTLFASSNIRSPLKYSTSSYLELQNNCNALPYYDPGFMIYHLPSGQRTKCMNTAYMRVKNLRGNQADLFYQYLVLRKENNIREYLYYYLEHNDIFYKYEDTVRAYTKSLYSNYIECYIRHAKPLIEFPQEYRLCMFNLHKHYLDNLKAVNRSISKNEVIIYVNNLEPSSLFHKLRNICI